MQHKIPPFYHTQVSFLFNLSHFLYLTFHSCSHCHADPSAEPWYHLQTPSYTEATQQLLPLHTSYSLLISSDQISLLLTHWHAPQPSSRHFLTTVSQMCLIGKNTPLLLPLLLPAQFSTFLPPFSSFLRSPPFFLFCFFLLICICSILQA